MCQTIQCRTKKFVVGTLFFPVLPLHPLHLNVVVLGMQEDLQDLWIVQPSYLIVPYHTTPVYDSKVVKRFIKQYSCECVLYTWFTQQDGQDMKQDGQQDGQQDGNTLCPTHRRRRRLQQDGVGQGVRQVGWLNNPVQDVVDCKIGQIFLPYRTPSYHKLLHPLQPLSGWFNHPILQQ